MKIKFHKRLIGGGNIWTLIVSKWFFSFFHCYYSWVFIGGTQKESWAYTAKWLCRCDKDRWAQLMDQRDLLKKQMDKENDDIVASQERLKRLEHAYSEMLWGRS